MKIKNKKWAYVLSIFIICVFVLEISPTIMQNDTFWSIKVGERLVKEGVFGLDNFSIHNNLYYVAHHFLTDIIIYIVYAAYGFIGLYFLEVILMIVIVSLLYILNFEVTNKRIVSFFMVVIQAYLLHSYISVRAQMISFIVFIIELILLEKYKKNDNIKYLIGLSILPIILANFHMGTAPLFFIFLIVNLVGYIKIRFLCFETVESTDKRRIKRLALVILIGVVLLFINPYFLKGVLYPFKTFGNEFINSTIQEFQPYNVRWDGGIFLICIFIMILTLLLNKDKKIKLDDVILLMGIIIMSFAAIRYVSFFAICIYIIHRYTDGLKNIIDDRKYSELDKKSFVGMLYVVLIIAIVLQSLNLLLDKTEREFVPIDEYPVKATLELKKYVNKNTRIFNEYSWGSYLMLNNIKVYIDSRCDFYTKEYSGVEIADDYNKLMSCNKDYLDIINKYNLNTFIIPSECNLSTLLNTSSQFNNVYEDDTATIFIRNR